MLDHLKWRFVLEKPSSMVWGIALLYGETKALNEPLPIVRTFSLHEAGSPCSKDYKKWDKLKFFPECGLCASGQEMDCSFVSNNLI